MGESSDKGLGQFSFHLLNQFACLEAGTRRLTMLGQELASLPAAGLAGGIVLDVLEWRERQRLTETECAEGSCRDSVVTC